MPDRKTLEETLKKAIRKAENDIADNPKLKSMINQMRQMYRENSDEFLSGMGFGTPNEPSSPVKPNLPNSRIPELLYLLDSMGKGAESPSFGQSNSVDIESIRNRINRCHEEISKRKRLLKTLQNEERSIQRRSGRYSIPSVRLKAERLLRELPGEISQLNQHIQKLQEEINENS